MAGAWLVMAYPRRNVKLMSPADGIHEGHLDPSRPVSKTFPDLPELCELNILIPVDELDR